MHHLIDAGDRACEEAKCKDFLALAAAAHISETRTVASDGGKEPHLKTVHIIRSLKRPEEVSRLREIYRSGFYLISVFAPESRRKKALAHEKKVSNEEAGDLIARDLKESDNPWGQRLQKTFHQADVFVSLDDYESELRRFVNLIFGERFSTPDRDEYGMFLAAAAAVRSSQPGRQVGAAILNDFGDVLSVGCNEVPRAGGGSYWENDSDDSYDVVVEVVGRQSSVVGKSKTKKIKLRGRGGHGAGCGSLEAGGRQGKGRKSRVASRWSLVAGKKQDRRGGRGAGCRTQEAGGGQGKGRKSRVASRWSLVAGKKQDRRGGRGARSTRREADQDPGTVGVPDEWEGVQGGCAAGIPAATHQAG